MEHKRIETNYILSFEKKVWCYAPVWGGEAQHKIEQKKGTNFASNKKTIHKGRTNKCQSFNIRKRKMKGGLLHG